MIIEEKTNIYCVKYYYYVLVGLNLAIDLERIPNHEKIAVYHKYAHCGLSVICQFFPMTGCKTCGSAEWFKNGIWIFTMIPKIRLFFLDPSQDMSSSGPFELMS